MARAAAPPPAGEGAARSRLAGERTGLPQVVARVNVLPVLFALAGELALLVPRWDRPAWAALAGVGVQRSGALQATLHEAQVDDVSVPWGHLLLAGHDWTSLPWEVIDENHHSLSTACTRRIPRLCTSAKSLRRAANTYFYHYFNHLVN